MQVPVLGGPCAGKTFFSVGTPRIGDVVPCGFHYYVYRADGFYHDVGTIDPRAPGPTGGLGTRAPKGWHDLQVAVNRHLPTSLVHSARVRRATRRALAQQARRR
jgi:hypothetical protein